MAAAYLNIKIPQMLGDIVNVVAGYAGQGGEEARKAFMTEIRQPAWDILKAYVAQGAVTFAYIYCLSCVGGFDFTKALFSVVCNGFETLQESGWPPKCETTSSRPLYDRMWPSSTVIGRERSSPA
jgi:hypothetical protein